MKRLLYLLVIIVFAVGCNGATLNEKQLQQVKEGKADRAIRRVTEAQIMEVTLAKGEEIVRNLTVPNDTTIAFYEARWLYDSLTTSNSNMAQLQEAYLYSKENNQPLPAHVELYSSDTLLYAVTSTINGNSGIWFIYMDKKTVVKTIE